MYTYRIKFYGRLLNAIGVRYEITEMVIADTRLVDQSEGRYMIEIKD